MEGEGGDVPHDETFEQFTARYGSVGASQTSLVRGMHGDVEVVPEARG